MKLIDRTRDVVTGSRDLEDLHTLKDFPVFMGSVEHDQTEDIVCDMSWLISRESGLIQLKKLLPLDVLYQAQTTTGAIGAIWMAHHKAFANFIDKYKPTSVLELGGAHGILSTEYHAMKNVSWTILEPIRYTKIFILFNLVLNLILLFIVLKLEIKNKYYKYYNLILDKYFLRKHK